MLQVSPQRNVVESMKLLKINQKLRDLIESAPMTQSEIALTMGVQNSRISEWKSGPKKPTVAQILKLAKLLNVPVEYLIDDSMDEPPAPPTPQRKLTDGELSVLEAYHDSGLSARQAIKRIEGEVVRVLGVRYETEADVTRERQQSRPKSQPNPKRDQKAGKRK